MSQMSKLQIFVVLILIGGWVTLPFSVAAQEINAIDPKLTAAGWKELKIPGAVPANYRLTNDQDIEVRTQSGVSILYRILSPKEQDAQSLTWRWRVDETVPATDPARAGYDDRDLAVHVWFPDDASDGIWKALGRVVKSVFGVPQIGKVLTYAFGGTGERYRRLINPHHDPDGIIILLRPSGTETGKWFKERINFTDDFESAFGEKPLKPIYLAISADSDDTQSRSLGRISGLMFNP